ncbi:Plasminogen [Frankliniella fusca]|uniref:Plasminogen n=1 Tax=Frankliniella fusca TaxID=407009 RepID=A0AAE1LS84_9NEOP|nr:Plasminogen [Frankliniella fusca]
MTAIALLFVVCTLLTRAQKLDLNSCKLSHSGVDYRGTIARSFSGPRCRFWDSKKARTESITDADFPDGSRKAAANRCRNPTGQRLGPWCYTKDPSLASDVCDVPLCAAKECRLTGAGVEYAGDVARASAGQPCLEWAGIGKYRRDNPAVLAKLSGRLFPDASVRWAGRKCRNPDGWAGGPWCYVKSTLPVTSRLSNNRHLEVKRRLANNRLSEAGAAGTRVTRAHCDVPACEPRNCTVFTTYSAAAHSDYTELPPAPPSFRFAVKLWDPTDWQTATARLAFSLLAGPATGRQQLERRTGFELVLSNGDTHFTGFERDAERVPGLLTAANWTELRVTWGDDYLTLLREGRKKPVLVQDFPRGTRGRNGRVEVRAYAVSGRRVLWSVPACGDDCPVHTASAETFSRVWAVRHSPTGPSAQVFVRSRRPVCLLFRGAPAAEVPDLRVCVDHGNDSYVAYRRGADANVLRLKQAPWPLQRWRVCNPATLLRIQRNTRYISTRDRTPVYPRGYSIPRVTVPSTLEVGGTIKAFSEGVRHRPQVSSGKLLSWWSWRELSVTLSSSTGLLSVWARSLSGPGVAVLETEVPEDVRGPLWFGVAPLEGVALFTLFCVPKDPGPPMPPECHRPGSTAPYAGSEWTTATGLPCLPWSAPDLTLPEDLRDDALFPDGSREAALDRCRNVGMATPFCFAAPPPGPDGDGVPAPWPCAVRECRAAHCRLAGTANDYMGARNVSRAGRACEPWAVAAPPSLSNGSLYPEQDVKEASNFCRNPSRSVAGAWCFTADTTNSTAADLCDIRDCAKPEECTIIYRGGAPEKGGGGLYILPTWRMVRLAFSLKEWNPEMADGIVFDLRPSVDTDKDGFHRLAIGAAKNEKITFAFVDAQGREELLNSKTVPHIVSAGQWASLWLRFAPGRVLLGQQGVETPIFDWPYKQGEKFVPTALRYQSVQRHPIGLHLDCPNSDCPIQRVDSDAFTSLFPLNAWRPQHDGRAQLQLAMQGSGVALVALYGLPEDPPSVFRLERNAVSLSRGNRTLEHVALAGAPVLVDKKWAYIHISLQNNKVVLRRNGSELLAWPGTLPAYLFSVGAARGTGAVSWAVNCVPADLSGEAVHGAWSPWSPWSCSAPCGGGHGQRTRTCTHPAPNILGRPCAGASSVHGPCSEWACGRLSPGGLQRARAALLRPPARQLRARPGARLQLRCHAQAQAVREEAPRARIVWIANSDRVLPEEGRVEVSEDAVVVRRADAGDSGSWACVALVGPLSVLIAVMGHGGHGHQDGAPHGLQHAAAASARLVLRVWAVAVRASRAGRRTLPLRLRCGALQLARLYDQLHVSWTLNGRLYKLTNL